MMGKGRVIYLVDIICSLDLLSMPIYVNTLMKLAVKGIK